MDWQWLTGSTNHCSCHYHPYWQNHLSWPERAISRISLTRAATKSGRYHETALAGCNKTMFSDLGGRTIVTLPPSFEAFSPLFPSSPETFSHIGISTGIYEITHTSHSHPRRRRPLRGRSLNEPLGENHRVGEALDRGVTRGKSARAMEERPDAAVEKSRRQSKLPGWWKGDPG